MTKKKQTPKVLVPFSGKIPLPSVSEQIAIALKEQSPNYPIAIQDNLNYPTADSFTFKGFYKKEVQSNIFLTKKQIPFYAQHEWHNVGATIFQVIQDFNGILFANKNIYITKIQIQHTALATVTNGDYVALRQENSTGERWLWYIMDKTKVMQGIEIDFPIPLKVQDYYYLDRPDIGATEYFEMQIYGWLEDK
jgi:hypothetical protein